MRYEREIIQLIHQYGFAQHLDVLRLLLKPCIRIIPHHVNNEIEILVGASKLGGQPDLPLNQSYPTYKGTALNFVGQLNLSELRPCDVENVLPEQGILYFFYQFEHSYEDMDNPDRWRIIYHNEQAIALKRHEVPIGVYIFPVCQVEFFQEHMLPDLICDEAKHLDETFTQAEVEKYYELRQQITKLYPHNENYQYWHISTHLLGYPDHMQLYDVRTICPSLDSRLLLQVDSEPDANMMWGDCGRLYWCISDKMLKDQIFSDVSVAEEGG